MSSIEVSPELPATRTSRLGRDVFFEFLENQGIPYIFGNPGTTELPFVDGCTDHPSVRYVLALHEDIAVAQAMGYARASGKVGVVNLHVTPGVAHGLGNLYNAFRARVPLLVTAGQHHAGLLVQDPILVADLVGLMRPFTKWAYEVRMLDELPIALQRAFKELNTPPYGPVFLSFATNLFLESYDGDLPAAVSRVAPVVADPSAVGEAVDVLVRAAKPVIVAGDGVGHGRAWGELAALAEAIGAAVYTEGYATLWGFPSDHPHYVGPMPNLSTPMRQVFDDVDVALMCGITCQAPVSRYDEGGPLVPWGVKVVAVDDSPAEIGKNGPVEVGLVGDVRRNLRALVDALQRTPIDRSGVVERTRAVRAVAAARIRRREEEAGFARAAETVSPALVAAELRDRLPAEAILVDEAISNRPAFVNGLSFGDPLSFFSANGISLGYSTGAAVGMQMALPHRRVVNVVGDGSLLYYPHALWTAARAQAPVLVVVLNNGCYRVLKLIIDRMGGPWGADGQMTPGLDVRGPAVDFVGLAGSFGVPGERVTTPGELGSALDRGLAAAGPYLVDVVIEQE